MRPGHRRALSRAGTTGRYAAGVALLVALLVVVPILELYVFVQVAWAIGFWNALGLVILISLVGAWLVKRQGLWVLRRVQDQVDRGQVPGRTLADGFLLLLAGVLLVLPGFVTDGLGVLLLLPPVRAVVRALVLRRWRGRVRVISATHGGPIVDTTATEWRDEIDP
jgi:UPF0716 protein FxsA